MARGRMIAKTLSTSEKRASLHRAAGKLAEFCQALYPLLVAHADDSGRQQGDTFTVKHLVDPSSPRPLSDFGKALTHLAEAGLILWYEADGRKVIEICSFAEHQPGLKNRGNSKFAAMPANAVVCREMPSELNRTELNRTEGKGTGNGAHAPVPLAEVPSDQDPSAPEGKVEAVVLMWNEVVAGSKLPQCRGLSDNRRKHIRARMRTHILSEIRETFAKARASPFANGQNDRGWVMTFDWVMESEDNFLKVSEGKYDARGAPQQPAGPQSVSAREHRYARHYAGGEGT